MFLVWLTHAIQSETGKIEARNVGGGWEANFLVYEVRERCFFAKGMIEGDETAVNFLNRKRSYSCGAMLQ